MDLQRLHQSGATVPACCLLLLTFLAYLPALDAGFIIDDGLYVTQDSRMQTLEGLGQIWTQVAGPEYRHQYYPLTSTAFWVQHQFWGQRPVGYHLVNVLLHAVNALLLWRLLRRLAVPGAWVAAAVFAVHPVNVQSVIWVAELKNVLAAFFFLLSMLVFVHWFERDPRRWTEYALGSVLFVAALLSKTATSLMPPALLAIFWWKRSRLERRDLAAIAPLALVAAAFVGMTVYLETHMGGAGGDSYSQSGLERSLVAGRALWFYAGHLLWPAGLTFIYPRWAIDPGVWWQYLYPLAAIGVIAALWWKRDRLGKGPVVAVGFFMLALAPVYFVQVAFTRFSWVSDHWQYWASMGLIALVVGVVAAHGARWQSIPAAAVICLLAGLTWDRCRDYETPERLWRDTVTRNPDAWMAHNSLGLALKRQGRYAEAEACYRESIRLYPDYVIAHNNLANTLQIRGRLDEAIDHLRVAVRLNPDYAEAHFNLGNTLRLLGRPHEAIDCYRESVRLDPGFRPARHNLALLTARTPATASVGSSPDR